MVLVGAGHPMAVMLLLQVGMLVVGLNCELMEGKLVPLPVQVVIGLRVGAQLRLVHSVPFPRGEVGFTLSFYFDVRGRLRDSCISKL